MSMVMLAMFLTQQRLNYQTDTPLLNCADITTLLKAVVRVEADDNAYGPLVNVYSSDILQAILLYPGERLPLGYFE